MNISTLVTPEVVDFLRMVKIVSANCSQGSFRVFDYLSCLLIACLNYLFRVVGAHLTSILDCPGVGFDFRLHHRDWARLRLFVVVSLLGKRDRAFVFAHARNNLFDLGVHLAEDSSQRGLLLAQISRLTLYLGQGYRKHLIGILG